MSSSKSETYKKLLNKSKKTPYNTVNKFRSQVLAKNIGKIRGLIGKNFDNETKLQKKYIDNFYVSINGVVEDNYDDIIDFIKKNPAIVPYIQSLFDLEEKRMGRIIREKPSKDIVTDKERYEKDFEVDNPTAAVFIHSVLREKYPDFTFTNYTEEEARNIIDKKRKSTIDYGEEKKHYEEIEKEEEITVKKPRYVSGGKSKKSSVSKHNKTQKINKK